MRNRIRGKFEAAMPCLFVFALINGAFPSPAHAGADAGRAPGFPPVFSDPYVAVAPNDLDIPTIFISYPNEPDAFPTVDVFYKNMGRHSLASYYGFNDEGLWLTLDANFATWSKRPELNGKIITLSMKDGKAVIVSHNKFPRGLRNFTSSYPYALQSQDHAERSKKSSAVRALSGRAPAIPTSILQGGFEAAANSLGITVVTLNYPNKPDAIPEIAVPCQVATAMEMMCPTEYLGFNADGVWLMSEWVPKTNGKPFTVSFKNRQALIVARDKIPHNLRNAFPEFSTELTEQEKNDRGSLAASTNENAPTGAPAAILNSPGVANALRDASNGRAAAPNSSVNRSASPSAANLNTPDMSSALRGAIGDAGAQVGGDGGKFSGGVLTYQDAGGKSQSYKVERYAAGMADTSQLPANQGAFLYKATDGKSGILFTLLPGGKVTGMKLNEQMLGSMPH